MLQVPSVITLWRVLREFYEYAPGLVLYIMYNYVHTHKRRFGPSGTLQDKLFRKSKTELYYYGGQTFTAAPTHKRSASDGKCVKTPAPRLFTPGSSEML